MMEWLKKHDVLSKVLAVLIALVLWFYVIGAGDLGGKITVDDISPVFFGSEELAASKNLMVVGEYEIKVEVSGDRNSLISLSSGDIRAEVDVSKITSAGTYELPYTVTLPSAAYKLEKKSPDKLAVKFDEEDVVSVPVRLATDDFAAEGYVVDMNNASIVPKELKISGLQEDVERVSYAQILIDKKKAKSSVVGQFDYAFYDANGKIIKDAEINADFDRVDVSIPVLKTKEVPLTVALQGHDGLKKYVNYSIEPQTILLAGEEKMIDAVTSLDAGVIKLSEVASGAVKKFTVTTPDGIVNMSGITEVSAQIKLEGLAKKTVKTTLIELINTYTLPSGYKVSPVTTSINVDIIGTEEALKQISSANVRAVADLEYIVLSKGKHPVPVSIVIDGVSDAVVAGDETGYSIYVDVR